MSVRELQAGAELTDQDVAGKAAEAAEQTARDLVTAGFDAAWADGPNVYARKGNHTFVMRNHVRQGPTGNRDRMLDLFAAMVVRRLTSGDKV